MKQTCNILIFVNVLLIFLFFVDKAKSLFNCGTRMEKALQRLAESNLTARSKSPSSMQDSTTQTREDGIPKVNVTIMDNSFMPSTQTKHLNTKLFKGISKTLLEKVKIINNSKIIVDIYYIFFNIYLIAL